MHCIIKFDRWTFGLGNTSNFNEKKIVRGTIFFNFGQHKLGEEGVRDVDDGSVVDGCGGFVLRMRSRVLSMDTLR